MVPLTMDVINENKRKDEGLQIRPHQLWSAFCRHWFLAINLGLIAAATVGYLAWKYVPTPFRAEAAVIVHSRRPQIGFDLPEDRENLNIIKSRAMQLIKHPRTINSALFIVYDKIAKQQSRTARDAVAADDRRFDSVEEQKDHPAEQPTAESDDAQESRLAVQQTEIEFTGKDTRLTSMIETFQDLPNGMTPSTWLRSNLVVRSTSDETFTVSLEGESPEELQLIVNAVQTAFFDSLAADKIAKFDNQEKELIFQIDDYQERISKNQTLITRKKSELAGTEFDEDDIKRENDLRKRSEIEAEIRKVDRDLIELKAQLGALERRFVSQEGQSDSSSDDSGKDPTGPLSEQYVELAIKLDPRYRDQDARIRQIKSQIEPWKRHLNWEKLPEVIALGKQLENAQQGKDELEETLRKEYQQLRKQPLDQNGKLDNEALKEQIEGLETYREGLRGVLDQISPPRGGADDERAQLSVEIADLEDQVKTDKEFLESLQRKKDASFIEDKADDRIQSFYEAELPTLRETKKRSLLMAGGGLGVFGIVVTLFTLFELRFMRVSSLRLLEDEFHFPILGTIPHLPAKVLRTRQPTRKAAVYKHTFTEAIDSARTVMLNLQKKAPMKILMVTSALGGEGKSTLSSHLAISFARAGRKTLLIDGDLRRPRVHEVFQIPDFPGFCETLRGETPAENCIFDSGVPGLDIMPAGEVDPFTLRMLAEQETQDVFNRLRQDYDLVLFDSSPVLPVADSLVIMQSIDGVVLSIRKNHSRVSKVGAALKKIELVGGNVLGGIVIGINEAEYGDGAGYYAKSLDAEEPVLNGAG